MKFIILGLYLSRQRILPLFLKKSHCQAAYKLEKLVVSQNSLSPFLKWSVTSIQLQRMLPLGGGEADINPFHPRVKMSNPICFKWSFPSCWYLSIWRTVSTFLHDGHNLHSPHIPSYHCFWDSSNHVSLMNRSHHSTSGTTYLDFLATISNSELPFCNFLSSLSPSLCTFFLLSFLSPFLLKGSVCQTLTETGVSIKKIPYSLHLTM